MPGARALPTAVPAAIAAAPGMAAWQALRANAPGALLVGPAAGSSPKKLPGSVSGAACAAGCAFDAKKSAGNVSGAAGCWLKKLPGRVSGASAMRYPLLGLALFV